MTNKRLTKILAPIFIGATLFSSMPYLTGCGRQNEPEFNESYQIKRGDTLWNIVKKNNNYTEIDPRKVIYDIREENNIDKVGNLQPGQEIKLPDYQ
ncbi:MAG: LysM peptidoglycan-binding domain-containing protein [Minisyncoccales bacterium]